MEDDGTLTIVALVIFVCCIVSCIIGLLLASSSGTDGKLRLDFGALLGWKPTSRSTLGDTTRDVSGGPSVYGYDLYRDFKGNDASKIGNPVTSKSIDQCRSLCGATASCKGFSTDNTQCQLYNNVTILERQKGSTIYGSGDFGAVKYLHIPFGHVSTSIIPEIATVRTGLADSIVECGKKRTSGPCKGFVMDGSNGHLFPSIIAVDSEVSGDTYADPDSMPQFIREGHYNYTSTPNNTWTSPAGWMLSMNGNDVNIPTSNIDWFTMYSATGFDAGLDTKGQSYATGNTLSVSSVNQCADACKGNAWCQSFTFGGNSCYMRHDRSVQHFPRTAASGNPCNPNAAPPCACGRSQDNILECAPFTEARDGHDGTGNTTYVKKLYPLDIACPMDCANTDSCIMSVNTQTTCNKYNSIPTGKTPNGSYMSTWLFDKYPQ